MHFYETCPRCLHRELSDGYGGNDCPTCNVPMNCSADPRVFIINGSNQRVLYDADIVARFDPLAVVELIDRRGKTCWSITHVPTGFGVFLLRGARNRARTVRFARALARVIQDRDLDAWYGTDAQSLVSETPRDVQDWIAANRDESLTRYVPLRDAHERANLHRDRMEYERYMSGSSIRRAFMRDDYTGICRSCGHEQGGVEADAQRYKCGSCGAHDVYGAEQLIAMGLDQDE